MSSDIYIQHDLMTALVAFADTPDQVKYWNGFALYCMEVAVGFINTYTNEFGTSPPGLRSAELSRKQNESSRTLTRAQIKSFVNGGAFNADFDQLIQHFTGSQNTAVTDATKDKDKAVEEAQRLKVEIRKEKNMREQLEKNIDAKLIVLQQSIASLGTTETRAHSVTQQIQKDCKRGIDTISGSIAKMDKKKIEVTDRFLHELKTLKEAKSDTSIKNSIEVLIRMFAGSESVESAYAISQRHAAELVSKDARIKVLETEIERLKEQQRDVPAATGAVAPIPAVVHASNLSDEARKILTAYSKLGRLKTRTDICKVLETVIDYNVFSNLGPEVPKLMQNIIDTLKKYQYLINAIHDFQRKYDSQPFYSAYTECFDQLKTNTNQDPQIQKLFSSVLGVNKQDEIQKLIDLFDQETYDVNKTPYLILKKRALRSAASLYMIDLDTNSFTSNKIMKSFADFDMTLRHYEKTMRDCLILHLFQLLKGSFEKIIKKEVVLPIMNNVIINLLQLPDDNLTINYPHYNEVCTIYKTRPDNSFPTTLVSQGMYFHEMFTILDESEPVLREIDGKITTTSMKSISKELIKCILEPAQSSKHMSNIHAINFSDP